MDPVTSATVAEPVLMPSGHPLQRCGVWAVTLMAGGDRPETVTEDDMERVVERLVEDIVTAATAPKDSVSYDWWKVLFALYPNSKPTHAKRSRDRAVLYPQVAELFAPDPMGAPLLPCTFCARPSGTVWTKTNLPMFESERALNTLPPGVPGWPVCRACRVALWAMPYGAWVTQGSATVLTCDDTAVEQEFATRNLVRAGRIRQLGFAGLKAGAGPEAVVVRALREHAADSGGACTLWTFKNDNQEPWLRVTETRQGIARFLRAMRADADCRHGWAALQRSMHRRDRSGAVTVDGATAAARTLFDPVDDEERDRLPLELMRRARDPDALNQRTLRGWRALCRLYQEVMYDMDPGRLDRATVMLADWITQDGTRGRFNEFRRAVNSAYDLQKLLMKASARLFLDGSDRVRINDLIPLLQAEGNQGWRVRGQLYFDVLDELIRRGVRIGKSDDEDDPASEDGEYDDGDEGEEYA